jgi:hypothetical protein
MIPLKKGDYMRRPLWTRFTYMIECLYSLATGRYTTDITAMDIAINVYGKYLFVNFGVIQDAPKFMLFSAECENH